MQTILLILLSLFIILFGGAFYVSIFASKFSKTIRTICAFAYLPVTIFCVYGFLAAQEPGNSAIYFRIGYPIIFIISLMSIIRLKLSKNKSV